MEIILKLAPRSYDRLRNCIPSESPVHEAIERASRIDYAVEGVMFAGYAIPCSEQQLRIILEIAKQHCPEITADVEKALASARST